MMETIDNGTLIGGLGFFLGAAITGFVTWYTVSRQSKHDLKMSELQYRREGFDKLTELFFPLKMLIAKDLAHPDWKSNIEAIYEKIVFGSDKLHAITFSHFPDYEEEIDIKTLALIIEASRIVYLKDSNESEEGEKINYQHHTEALNATIASIHDLLRKIGKTCK